MVEVDVDDGDFPGPVLPEEVFGRHGDVVEHAETHGRARRGMVAWWAAQSETGRGAPLPDGSRDRTGPTGGFQRQRPGLPSQIGVAVVVPAQFGDPPDCVQVLLFVHTQQDVPGDFQRGGLWERIPQLCAAQFADDGLNPLGALRVSRVSVGFSWPSG